MRGIQNLGSHERRQRQRPPHRVSFAMAHAIVEFSGTLLGFDDYVSKCCRFASHEKAAVNSRADMVLEDVTEL